MTSYLGGALGCYFGGGRRRQQQQWSVCRIIVTKMVGGGDAARAGRRGRGTVALLATGLVGQLAGCDGVIGPAAGIGY